jgi:hypothetical protein
MTGPAPEVELTERLAAALPESLGPVGLRHRAVPQLDVPGEVTGYGEVLLAALLPVVQAYADERAAEALEAAADDEERRVTGFAGWFLSFLITRLRARAAALRTDTETSTR